MAFHEFGLLPCAPGTGERFDRYEPEKYACIRVHDDLISDIQSALCSIETFWHIADIPRYGLDEAGITLIPPESAGRMAEEFREKTGFSELTGLLRQAHQMQKWIIHFGI